MTRCVLPSVCFVFVSVSQAATLNHQGVVTVAGERFTGDGAFRFALVDPNTDTYLWTNDSSAVVHPDPPTAAVTLTVVSGIYNVRLGNTSLTNMTDVPADVFSENDNVALRVWFDDQLGGDVHRLMPDLSINVAPYALQSSTSEQLNIPGTATPAAVVDGNGKVIIGDAAPAGGLIVLGVASDATVNLPNGSIGHDEIAANAIDSARVQNASITADDLAINSVTAFQIATDAVTSVEIATNAVGTAEIITNGVGAAEIAANAVGASEIASNAVGASEIAAGAVNTSELATTLNFGNSNWNLNFAGGELNVTASSGFPVIDIDNSSSGIADGLWVDTGNGASSSTWGLYVTTDNGRGVYIDKDTNDNQYALYVSAADEALFVNGDFVVSGGTKSGVVDTPDGPTAIFAVEGPEVDIYTTGTATLVEGVAHITFDPLFTHSVSDEIDIRVNLTPVDEWSGLYVVDANPNGFTARSGAGADDVTFHWAATGRRVGYEIRPDVTVPDEAENEALLETKKQLRAEKRASAADTEE